MKESNLVEDKGRTVSIRYYFFGNNDTKTRTGIRIPFNIYNVEMVKE